MASLSMHRKFGIITPGVVILFRRYFTLEE